MMIKPYFTTSWDDGSIYDLRLASLLAKYNIKGTFYIPLKNKERRDSLSPAQINEIAEQFEVGAHTYSHTVLTEVRDSIAWNEIKGCKNALEDILGKEIKAFCFPRGKYNSLHLELVREAGFSFARTTGYLRIFNVVDKQKRLMHTTIQFFPHKPRTYFISSLKRGDFEGFRIALSSFTNLNFTSFLNYILQQAEQKNGIFHLWGHSWEIQEYNLWNKLEDFLKQIKDNNFVFKTNLEVWDDYI